MESEFDKLQRISDIMSSHGRELVLALIFLIAGLYLSKYLYNEVPKE